MRGSGLDCVACRKRPSRRPSRLAIAAIRRSAESLGLKLSTISPRAAGELPVPAYEGPVHRPGAAEELAGMCIILVSCVLRLCSGEASVVRVCCERMSA